MIQDMNYRRGIIDSSLGKVKRFTRANGVYWRSRDPWSQDKCNLSLTLPEG